MSDSPFILDPNSANAPAGGTAPAPIATPDAAGALIKNTDTESFVTDVIEASAQIPVIVDFWAPWCEPCKTLGPMLEKLVTRAGGLVRMVKVNVDENQPLAQQLQIKSIPTVYAFKDGKPVDAFQGALSESQMQAFIDKLLAGAKPPLDAAMEAAQAALDAGDAARAEEIYGSVLAQDGTLTAALAGLIRAAAMVGDTERAREMVEALDTATRTNKDVTAAVSALELAEQSAGHGDGDLDDLTAKVEAKPTDLDARLELAQALYAKHDAAGAIDHLLEMVRQNRGWNDDAARKQLVMIFDALGSADPLVVDGRRALSTILFS